MKDQNDQPEPPTERPTLGGDDNARPTVHTRRTSSPSRDDSPVISSNPTSRAEPPVPQWAVANKCAKVVTGMLQMHGIPVSKQAKMEQLLTEEFSAIIARHAPQPAPAGVSDTERNELLFDFMRTCGKAEGSEWTGGDIMDALTFGYEAAMRGEKEGL